MQAIMTTEKFNQVMEIAPIIQKVIPEDCAIAICSPEKLCLYLPGEKIDQKVKVGAPLEPKSGIGKAIHSGQSVITKVEESLFGVPYIVSAIPIKEKDGTISGGISISLSIEREQHLLNIGRSLHHAIGVFEETAEQIVEKTSQLEVIEKNFYSFTHETGKLSNQVTELMDDILKISKQTEILSLNTSIEASRIGENGKVFQVLAKEMRVLSQTVNHSTETIQKQFLNLAQMTDSLKQHLIELNTISETLSNDTIQLSAQTQTIKVASEKLKATENE